VQEVALFEVQVKVAEVPVGILQESEPLHLISPVGAGDAPQSKSVAQVLEQAADVLDTI
jgi:hypothetical protein